MLKIKFTRIKNVIVMEIIKQVEIERDVFEWSAPNGIMIKSESCPELSYDKIYVRGYNHDRDNFATCYEYDSEEDAKNALQKYVDAVYDYNSQLKEEGKTEPAEVVIAE